MNNNREAPDLGPGSGDLVTATTDNRAADPVEGVLYLRYVPSLAYVQVYVITRGNRWRSVDPDSIRVVSAGKVSPEDLERDESLSEEPGWKPVRRLSEARQAGLLPKLRPRRGGTWAHLRDRLDEAVQPLVEAGWVVDQAFEEESWEYGDSLGYGLSRSGKLANPELYEDDDIVLWTGGESEDPNNPNPPLGHVDAGMTRSELEQSYREVGWLP